MKKVSEDREAPTNTTAIDTPAVLNINQESQAVENEAGVENIVGHRKDPKNRKVIYKTIGVYFYIRFGFVNSLNLYLGRGRGGH